MNENTKRIVSTTVSTFLAKNYPIEHMVRLSKRLNNGFKQGLK